MNTIIVFIISMISMIYFGVIFYAFFNVKKLASQFIDKQVSKKRWKIACFIKSLFWVFVALWLLTIAVAIQYDTEFFTKTTLGILIGTGVILNLLAAFIWSVFSNIDNTIRTNQADSLEQALKENPRGWKLNYFFSRKAIIIEEKKEFKEKFIDSLSEDSEPAPVIIEIKN